MPFSRVRLGDEPEAAEEFAKSNGISRNAAIGILLKLGIQNVQQTDAQSERIGQMEENIITRLKAMQKSNYKALVYLTTSTSLDQPRQDKAETIANKNVSDIFGDEGE